MPTQTPFIAFPTPIITARFVKREKRFLAHMVLADGSRVIAHCPNTGTMRTCLLPGAKTLLWDSANPERKYPLSWKAIEIDGVWIGVDTLLPNRLAQAAIASGFIEELSVYDEIERERTISKGTRIDLVLHSDAAPTCAVEVKNVTLVEDGVARFPDAVTTRGLKHLEELMRWRAGKLTGGFADNKPQRAAMVYVVQRGDATRFRPADDIDPVYGAKLREAAASGVEVYALSTEVSPEGVRATGLLPVSLD